MARNSSLLNISKRAWWQSCKLAALSLFVYCPLSFAQGDVYRDAMVLAQASSFDSSFAANAVSIEYGNQASELSNKLPVNNIVSTKVNYNSNNFSQGSSSFNQNNYNQGSYDEARYGGNNYNPNYGHNNNGYGNYGRPDYYQQAALSQFSLCYAFQDNNKAWSQSYRGEGALLDGYHLNGVLRNGNFRDDNLFLVLSIRNQAPVIIDLQQRQGLSTVPTVLEDINGVSWRVSRTWRSCMR